MKRHWHGLFVLAMGSLSPAARLLRTAVVGLFLMAALSQAYGNIISDGGCEGYYDYPCMYAHENARIKAFVDAGWDVGGKEKFRFPEQWTVDQAPAGYLRVSEDAHSGNSAFEFGRGGHIYCAGYITPTGPVGMYPFKEGNSCIVRVWAKGTGTLLARIREYNADGTGVGDVAVGTPATLSAEWQEFIFVYTPKTPAPNFIRLAFQTDGLAKVDDVTMLDVVEFERLVATLGVDAKAVQADAAAGLVDKAAAAPIAAEVDGLLRKAKEAALTLPEQLALRDEIAPVAQRLKVIAWQGKGKRAGRIGLASERLGVEFYGKDLNFRIASISDPEKKVEFLGPFGSEVWRVKLVNPSWKSGLDAGAQPPAKCYLTSDSKCTDLRSDLSEDGRKLTLDWLGVEIPGSVEKLDVRVTVALPKGARLARWHIKVSGGVKGAALNEVHFPMLASLAPMTAEGEGDYLVVPDIAGRLIENPYQLKPNAPWMTLQMWALYSDKAGFYCAAEDGESYKKQFAFAGVPNEKLLHAQVVNFPENNMTEGNAYDMPYEAVLGTFDGTWWDASKLYRKWALEQKWCKAFGPLHSSKDTPQWYKDLPLWVLNYEIGGTEQDVLSGKVFGKMAGNYGSEVYKGVPFALHYYGWETGHQGYGHGSYFEPGFGTKGWPIFIKQMQETGARVVPYVQGSLFNTKLDWYTKEGGDKGAVYFPGGAPVIYPDKPANTYENMTWMCQASSQWQDFHAEVAKSLATFGVDGVYYDSYPGWQLCYNPAHGHPLGGGKYLAEGNRRLIARAREAAKAINPEMIFVSECPDETMVGALDGCLQFQFAKEPDNIPLFSSVYHDFILLWGNTFGADFKDYEKWAHIPIAYSFVRGDQLGWFAQAWLAGAPYATSLAKLRMGPAQKFITYGEMMEPPRFLNNVPTVTTPPWSAGSEKEPRTFAAVLHSAWKAPDRTLGLVFANISDVEQEVEYEFDAARYGLPLGENYVVTDMVSKKVVGTYSSPVIKRKDKVLPRQALVLEIGCINATPEKSKTKE